jgi:UDP-N-acetyl-D-glucosamine dehydrogenase
MTTTFQALHAAITERRAVVGVIGLGYVGLPLAAATARAGFVTVGFDTDPAKPRAIAAGQSYIDAVQGGELASLTAAGKLSATSDMTKLTACDVVIICVPTPLTRHRDPDLSFVVATGETIAAQMKAPQLVVLESTTYPGTTREVLKPILEAGGRRSGEDFFLAFSPEREDPGNASFSTVTIPKVVAGDGLEASSLAQALYGAVVEKVVPVSSLDVAEAVKITENIFRAVNIALVNELKVIFTAMGIDVWEVIEAAKTKPFGYMPFYPGPGLGGHCIPIDPFYLTWKSREFEQPTRFIELAGEVNHSMPRYVVDMLVRALEAKAKVALSAARILLLGAAYKKNVGDLRESPSLKLIELLEERGALVDFHDPHVAEIPPTREFAHLAGKRSMALEAGMVGTYDAVLIATDHDGVDYGLVAGAARIVVDTRNVMARLGLAGEHIVKA